MAPNIANPMMKPTPPAVEKTRSLNSGSGRIGSAA